MATQLMYKTSPSLSAFNPAHENKMAWNRKGCMVEFSPRLSSKPSLRQCVSLQPVSLVPSPTVKNVLIRTAREGTRVSNAFEVEYKVRNYEVDQYRVVHNACYACYCQQARQEFMESIGVFIEEIAESGKSVALAESNLKYLAPLRSGDRFVVSVKVSGLTAVRLFFESLIYKLPNAEPILQEKATIVWLDENYRPIRVPSDVRSKLLEHMHRIKN